MGGLLVGYHAVGFSNNGREHSWFGVEDRLMVYYDSRHNDNYCVISIIYLLTLAPWTARVSSSYLYILKLCRYSFLQLPIDVDLLHNKEYEGRTDHFVSNGVSNSWLRIDWRFYQSTTVLQLIFLNSFEPYQGSRSVMFQELAEDPPSSLSPHYVNP